MNSYRYIHVLALIGLTGLAAACGGGGGGGAKKATATSGVSSSGGSSAVGGSSGTSGGTQVLTCPNGFVSVPANSSLFVSSFCVMKYEAKNVSGVAVSQAALTPWVPISQVVAKNTCLALGTKYDLISNPEWMAIAENIESVAANWSGQNVGVGALYRGHSDNSPAASLAVSNTADPYSGTGNNINQSMGTGKEQKRTHVLSNGEVLWDIAGNVWEWVDWTVGGSLVSGPTTCASGPYIDFYNVSCGELAGADYMPANPANLNPTTYGANYGLGRFQGGAGGAALRGGSLTNDMNAGIFSLLLTVMPSFQSTVVGFRCVYRP